jgi:short-chain fatty acids transporter
MSNGPLERLGRFMSRFADRWVPDPWIYAALLTFVAFGLAVIAGGASPREVAVAWQKGLWDPSILTLIAQFSLNLILCAAMARSPAVSALLRRLAAVPRTARFSIVWVSCLSILLSLISWAFCIVGGALFAQEACRQARRRGFALHYPLAIAAGYLGMMTWGCGLTSSAPLIVSTPGHALESVIGLIPLSVTLGS